MSLSARIDKTNKQNPEDKVEVAIWQNQPWLNGIFFSCAPTEAKSSRSQRLLSQDIVQNVLDKCYQIEDIFLGKKFEALCTAELAVKSIDDCAVLESSARDCLDMAFLAMHNPVEQTYDVYFVREVYAAIDLLTEILAMWDDDCEYVYIEEFSTGEKHEEVHEKAI